MPRKYKQKRKTYRGFTLLEIVLTMGILSILLGIVLFAVNPSEQTSKAQDITVKAVTKDFIDANVQYYVAAKKLPWENNPDCHNELLRGGALVDLPSCVEELTKGGKLDEEYIDRAQLKDIYVNKCGDTAVLCYKPRTKEEYESGAATYTKFGVNNPGCPGKNGIDGECYWCKPVMEKASCSVNNPPTPTIEPTPTLVPTVVLTPTPTPIPDLVPGYRNDETKLFKTYAVFFYDHPGFPPTGAGWNIQFSLRPDFGGDYTQTHRSFATGSEHSHTSQAISWVKYRAITMKYSSYQSLAGQYPIYNSNCGKTVYYRVTNWYNPSATDKKEGPIYTGVIDCNTKVNVVDPPLSWYTVYDQLNGVQKQYHSSWDFNQSGAIDWTDYWLGAFSTKTRYGGWQPPE